MLACNSTSFLFIAEYIPLDEWPTFYLFIRQLVDVGLFLLFGC